MNHHRKRRRSSGGDSLSSDHPMRRRLLQQQPQLQQQWWSCRHSSCGTIPDREYESSSAGGGGASGTSSSSLPAQMLRSSNTSIMLWGVLLLRVVLTAQAPMRVQQQQQQHQQSRSRNALLSPDLQQQDDDDDGEMTTRIWRLGGGGPALTNRSRTTTTRRRRNVLFSMILFVVAAASGGTTAIATAAAGATTTAGVGWCRYHRRTPLLARLLRRAIITVVVAVFSSSSLSLSHSSYYYCQALQAPVVLLKQQLQKKKTTTTKYEPRIVLQMKYEGMFLETSTNHPTRHSWPTIPIVGPGRTTTTTGSSSSTCITTTKRSSNHQLDGPEQRTLSLVHQRRPATVLGFDVRRSTTHTSTSSTRLHQSSSSSSSTSSPFSSSPEQQQHRSSSSSNSSNSNNHSDHRKTIVLPSSIRKMSYKWNDNVKKTTTGDRTTALPTTADQEDVEEVAATTTSTHTNMTVVQLKAQLGRYGLAKTGSKAILQDRWQKQYQLLLQRPDPVPSSSSAVNEEGDNGHDRRGGPRGSDNLAVVPPPFVADNTFGGEITGTTTNADNSHHNKSNSGMGLSPAVVAILHRRREIHQQKNVPWSKHKNNNSNNNKNNIDDDSARGLAHARQALQKIYHKPSSSLERSQHAARVYRAAKEADQAGDRETAKFLLRSQLELEDSPGSASASAQHNNDDARILRRLARLEHEDGHTDVARQILQEGLATHHPNNPHLWLGLATLQDPTAVTAKRECYRRALAADPHFAHAYHALATLEHTEGHIKSALEVLQTGLRYCPTNHRLHHAMGDLYRDAKILTRATASYHKALEYGPAISHGYAITALAFCAYEENNMDQCRNYLQRAIDGNPRQAHAWMSLAQLEESLGNIEAGRNVCRTAIAQYERYLLKKYHKSKHQNQRNDDPVAYKNALLRQIPRHRSGDKFLHVYRTWMRIEGRYGTVESFEAVYQQASAAFTDVRIQLDAARYYAGQGLNEQARQRFMDACKSSSRSVDAFRTFGLHEMKLGNYALAERIFYTGAMTGRSYFLAELLYAWAVCEWRTGQLQNAARLFEFALEESAVGNDNVRLRSFILFVAARFEFSRREYHRAQHFVGRCLAENQPIPGAMNQFGRYGKRLPKRWVTNGWHSGVTSKLGKPCWKKRKRHAYKRVIYSNKCGESHGPPSY